MATALKDLLGPEVPRRIAAMVQEVLPPFDAGAFLADALDGYEGLELMDRGRHWGRTLRRHLPDPDARAIEVLTASLGPPRDDTGEGVGMAPFLYLPHSFVIAENGLGCFDVAMRAQYELTQRFTAEFCIRPFLERHTADTLARLDDWTADASPHVRRLVSEGTRPRLPWAPRLREFQRDPAPVLALLERLCDDPSEYVRRSVANNLNDIGKDHPDLALATCRRWMAGAGTERRRLVRHALRSAVKAGDRTALAILGYDPDADARAAVVSLEPPVPRVGGSVAVEVEVVNPGNAPVGYVVDLRVGFARPGGVTGWRVFTLREIDVPSGASVRLAKRISLAQHTTRTHHPGAHRIEVRVNGTVRASATFEVASS